MYYNEQDDVKSGRSTMRKTIKGNSRKYPCPTCGRKNVLTPFEKDKGYQCNNCADADEGIY